jgi:hypothetical protein
LDKGSPKEQIFSFNSQVTPRSVYKSNEPNKRVKINIFNI